MNTLALELTRPLAMLPAAARAITTVGSTAAAGSGRRGPGYQTVVDTEGIAIVDVRGVLLKDFDAPWSTAMFPLGQQLRRLRTDEKIRGVLLNVYSPGGTVDGCDALGKDIAALAATKPTHGYCEDLCASAAVWCVSQTNMISANETAEVGSIGVYMAVADYSEMAAKDGIKVHLIRAGAPHKGAGTVGVPIEDEHLAKWQSYVDAHNATFLDRVSTGRGMPRAEVEKLNDGSLWIGQDAVQVGLVDHIEDFDQAAARLRVSANAVSPPPSTARRRGDATGGTMQSVAVDEHTAYAAAPGIENDRLRKQAVAEGWTAFELSTHPSRYKPKYGRSW